MTKQKRRSRVIKQKKLPTECDTCDSKKCNFLYVRVRARGMSGGERQKEERETNEDSEEGRKEVAFFAVTSVTL